MKRLSLFMLGLVLVLAGCAQYPPAVAPTAAPAPTLAAAVVTNLPAMATTVPTLAPIATGSPVPPTNTAIPSPTLTDAATPTDTATPTNTAAPTVTPTHTATSTRTHTATPSVTRTHTRVPATASRRPSPTPKLSGLAAAVSRTDNTPSHFETKVLYSNPFTGFELFTSVGERNPQGSHFTTSGKYCGCDDAPNGILEYTTVGDKVYLKGPVPSLKAAEARWYLVPPDKSAEAKSSLNKELLSPGLTEFNPVGDDTIDGVTYHVYTVDKATARQRLHDVLGYTEQELGQVVNIELSLWVGDDGFVHQTLARMDVKSIFDPNSTDIIKYQTTYSNFGAPVQITTPTDAVPLPQ